ncbi:MAG: prolipoprotein diacylglyceryl transferase [Planctomycetota bacterium]|nr:prolipoprotein diacylglyceryl transferase [Planctomycetota bacterium]
MYPVLFELPIFGFPIRSFGVMLAIGFLVAAYLWTRLMPRFGEDPKNDPERVSDATFAILVGVVCGGRLVYVIVESLRYLSSNDQFSAGYRYLHEPLSIFKVWEGGLVMYGGFFGAILMGLWSSKRRGLNPLNALDTALVAGFFGQGIGRIGCLLVGDDFGSVVPEAQRGMPFPIQIQVPSLEWLTAHPESLFPHNLAGETLWATQPWMTMNAIVISAVGYWMLKKRKYMGQAALVMLVHYAITRYIIESFRGDSIRGLWFDGMFSTSQLISILSGLIMVLLLIKFRGRRDNAPGSVNALQAGA